MEDILKKVSDKTVSSPMHLKIVLDKVFADSSEETTDVILRAYLWLAFIGLKETEAIKLTASDIDFMNRTITVGDKVFDIYSEGFEDIYKAATLEKLNVAHVNPDYKTPTDRLDGDSILRGTKRNISSILVRQKPYKDMLSIRPRITNMQKKANCGKSLSYTSVFASGLFYRMYERERSGQTVSREDFSFIAKQKVLDSIEAGVNQGKKIRHSEYRIEKQYYDNYKLWKEVYSV